MILLDIFSNDRSIYVESNGKKLDDGIKEVKVNEKWSFPKDYIYMRED